MSSKRYLSTDVCSTHCCPLSRVFSRRSWTTRSGSLGLLLLLLALPTLIACGKKGPPLPPLRNIPNRTSDLTLQQQGSILVLDMAYPSTTTSGMVLGGIDAVELLEFAKPADPEGELPALDQREFEVGSTPLLTLRGTELNAAVTGDRLQFRLPLTDPLPEEPNAQFFAVRTFKGEESSDISNRVGLVPIAPPNPPRNLDAEPQARGIELSWENDEEAEAFDIFRREAQVRSYDRPIGRAEGEDRTYTDRTAEFGKRYIYTVRSVAQADPLIYSAEAGEREIDYVDRFAPPLPSNFVALAERGSVRLRWDPSNAEDVAGYILYRRDPGQNFRRINEDPIQGSEYVDRGLSSGLTYAYRIQAVDQSGNESRRSPAVETTLR